MAASDLSRGRKIAIDPVPMEITYFLLAKEFHWTPEECDRQDVKKLKGIMHVLSTYNKIKNQEMEKEAKKANRR